MKSASPKPLAILGLETALMEVRDITALLAGVNDPDTYMSLSYDEAVALFRKVGANARRAEDWLNASIPHLTKK